jgi:YebC/PmpR family DNA-binding regulatory protein
MAGHSKWANIKHRKEKADLIKGKIFTRIIKEIITAVSLGGPDDKSNARLKLALQKAKAVNVPKETIERNIKKASSSSSMAYFEITYEIYGYGGVGLFLEIMTDNKNRTSSDIHIVMNKKGGTLAMPGGVAYNFDQMGVIQVLKDRVVEEDLFLAVTEAGALDFENENDMFVVLTAPDKLFSVKEVVDRLKVVVQSAELQRVPKNLIECSSDDQEANIELINSLELLDDVDAIYHNMKL